MHYRGTYRRYRYRADGCLWFLAPLLALFRDVL